jgi:hypothetical protein
MSSHPLPTPRKFLTTLLNTLTTSAPTQEPQTNAPYDPPSHPLKLIPASQRALLTTLHVLFPPPTLLQALDLLDRGLVTRFVLQDDSSTLQNPPPDNGLENAVVPPQANTHLSTSGIAGGVNVTETEKGLEKGKENAVYQVRSSQAAKGRFKDLNVLSTITYTVRLESWNCSCAAFTFAAFPGGVVWAPSVEDEDEGMFEDGDGDGQGEKGWEFGGRSRDEGNVPVCKHLLACVLAERWEGVLGGYVKERKVGREEMAGVGGEG